MPDPNASGTPHVVIIGSGFGGLTAAKALGRANVATTLVSKTAHHLFQPLLYQVATGILSPGDIAPVTRELVKRHRSVRVIQGQVDDIDLRHRYLEWHNEDAAARLRYDILIVAAGATTSYFGHPGFAAHAPGLKTVADALELRSRIFDAFERAEVSYDRAEVARLLTFTVIGAGATGVEMAGQIRELAGTTLRHEFRCIDPPAARVVLVDSGPSVLPAFSERLGNATRDSLTKLGVEVILGATVHSVDDRGVELRHADGSPEYVASECKIWAAGVQASSLNATLARQSGATLDRGGRITLKEDLSLPGHPDVYVIGDMMAVPGVPGVSPAAIQSAQHVVRAIRSDSPPRPFRYRDKGSMATIAKYSAVAQVGPVQVTGFIAWLLWLLLHLAYIAGFKQRITTLLRWCISFLSTGRSERVSTRSAGAFAEVGHGV